MSNIRYGEMPFDEPVSFEQFTGEPVYLYVQSQLSEYAGLAKNLRISPIVKDQFGNMILQMRSWCISGKIPTNSSSETFKYPDGVWQMFKSKFMPYWFTRKYPVRMHEETYTTSVNHYFVCPHLVTDPQGKHVQFMATGTPTAGRIHP